MIRVFLYYVTPRAICLPKDQLHHERTKHIDVRYHFMRSEKRIKMIKVYVGSSPTDMFKKLVAHGKFQHCLNLINVLFQFLIWATGYIYIPDK